jgi:hypothetical protein
MAVKERRTYPKSLENFKKLKHYIKKLNNGGTKTNRQDGVRTTNR